ncbi:GntR family transcriptional regulator [Dactylosporangium sp. NPDC051485]|uniref:GntR family transcriptional regulator n=1 Tax=Dactylosporangium sp. NPDC051485 TaxID=3154846 RepID=UPI003427B3CF
MNVIPATARSGLAVGRSEAVPRVTNVRLGTQIAELVRDDILFGRLPAGAAISQTILCERYGTSRMPVRDALRQLSHEGFVYDDGKGHSIVAAISREDIQDTYVIEGILCGLAARRVADNHDPEQILELRDFHRRMVAAMEGDDVDLMTELNWHFHRRVNQMAGSPKLLAVLRSHTLRLPRAFLRESPTWMKRANREHASIVAAIAKGDSAKADMLMSAHVASVGTHIADHLNSSPS